MMNNLIEHKTQIKLSSYHQHSWKLVWLCDSAEAQTGLLSSTAVCVGSLKIIFKLNLCMCYGNINSSLNTSETQLKFCQTVKCACTNWLNVSSTPTGLLLCLVRITNSSLNSNQMVCSCNSGLISTRKYF